MFRAPVESHVLVNNVEISLWEWPGEGPPVFFCHATGFHARIWDQVIANLAGRRCLAFDARGHGRSSKPAPPYAWRNFGADAAALAGSLELSGAIGVGHSMGGHAVTLAAALRPRTFAALLLIDPVIRAKETYTGPWTRAEFVAKRRNQWASAQEMFERFENRQPFSAWDRRVLKDYCEHGLTAAGGEFVLACPPQVEAAIYANSPAVESNIYPEIARVQIPVHVVRSGLYPDPANVMGTSPTAPDLASSFAHGADTLLAEHSHFIPMESPELVAKLIVNSLSLL
jgi:pimeloyl-ACP methyl ester carboxylesterase